MPYPPTIKDYYRSVNRRSQERDQLDCRPSGARESGRTSGSTTRIKFRLSPIAFDSSRQLEVVEVDREYTLRRDDFYKGLPAGTKRRETAISIQVPVQPSATIQAIWSHKLAPNPFSMSHPYPPFEYDDRAGLFKHAVSPRSSGGHERD